MDRVFLDANILFSAAYKKSQLEKLWELSTVTLLASPYVITEAETNLSLVKPESVGRLTELVLRPISFFTSRNFVIAARDRREPRIN